MNNDKLYNWLRRVRDTAAMNSSQPISVGMDIAYEAGRRIGVTQGMDVLLDAYTKFHEESEDKEKKL